MKPAGIFTALGKTGYDLFSFFFKGPKIDANLVFKKVRQHDTAIPANSPEGKEKINPKEIVTEYKLLLQNISSHSAQNVRILNSELFSFCELLPSGKTLSAKERITIDCGFKDASLATGNRIKFLGIPEEKVNTDLIIAYENEAGTTFYTIFQINDTIAINNYSLKNPLSSKE